MPLLDDLVSAWDLDEASGTRFDRHGANDLVEHNTVGSAAGLVGTAADFAAVNLEYLSGGETVLQDGDGDFTVEGWFRLNAVGGSVRAIVAKDQPGSRTFAVYVDTDGRLNGYVTKDGAFPGVQVPTVLSADTWYRFVFWHDSAANEIGLVLDDGAPVTTSHATGYDVGAGELTVGQNFGVNFFDGQVDLLALWDRVLTADERTRLYNDGAGLAYADFDEDVPPDRPPGDPVAATVELTRLVSARVEFTPLVSASVQLSPAVAGRGA